MDHLTGLKLYHLDRSLADRRALKLTGARGARIVSIAGDVWVTEDRRYDDVVLAAGESTVLERDGMALITAFDSADVEVVLPAAGEAAAAIAVPSIDDALVGRHVRAAHRMRVQAVRAAFAGAAEWVRGKLRPARRSGCCA